MLGTYMSLQIATLSTTIITILTFEELFKGMLSTSMCSQILLFSITVVTMFTFVLPDEGVIGPGKTFQMTCS